MDDLTCQRFNDFRIEWLCALGHERRFNIRCRKCANCKSWRVRRIIAICNQKFEVLLNDGGNFNTRDQVGLFQDIPDKHVFLWTFGTSLDYEGLGEIKKYWRLFSQRLSMRRLRGSIDYDALFYVIESGSVGRRLHIHAVVYGFVDQKILREIWAEVTGIQEPNVGFSCPKRCNRCGDWRGRDWVNDYGVSYCLGCGYFIRSRDRFEYLDARSAFNYLAKYMSKDIKNYYYLGRFLKLKIARLEKLVCNIDLVKEGNCEAGIVTKTYHEDRPTGEHLYSTHVINKVSHSEQIDDLYFDISE